MSYFILPMKEDSARIIVSWRYDESLNFYNYNLSEIEQTVQEFLKTENSYYSIFNNRNQLVAYCCFGPDARVKGGDYDIEALDIGFGMRPNMSLEQLYRINRNLSFSYYFFLILYLNFP